MNLKTTNNTALRHLECRLCNAPLTTTFVDLGMSPLCESVLTADEIDQMEPYFPLHVLVCNNCFLVQLREYVKPESIFSEYDYFSSYSTSWVEHARRYCEMVQARLNLGPDSQVFEIASNDGYLLQHFVPLGIRVTGVEPAVNVAAVAREKNIPTIVEFFGVELARRLVSEGKHADLIIGNNVLAQVPDLNDFVGGMAALLASNGVITLEFPHLERLIDENQFDTIYHEHFSYFSFVTIDRLAKHHSLKVFDVEHLTTHGGSLRVYLCHSGAPIPGRPALTRCSPMNVKGDLRISRPMRRFRRKFIKQSANSCHFLLNSRTTARSCVGMARLAKATRCSITAASAPISWISLSTATLTNTACTHLVCTFQFIRCLLSMARGRIICSSCHGT